MSADETKHYLANGQETAPDAREALEWARETTAQIVDLKFCDLLGTWQHMTLPIRAFDESAFDDGLGFDGSSIRGWQGISESDMLLMPDASSAILDPFTEAPTLSLICEIADPLTREPYAKRSAPASPSAPRSTSARRASPTRRTWGPSASSSSSTRSRTSSDRTARTTRSTRARATGTPASRASATRCARRRATSRPRRTTRFTICARRMVLTLERLGIPCEFHHHEVASGGQCEIDLRYQPLTRMADQIMTYKYVVKNVARAAGKSVTFMPKPIFGDNGSGMHTHQSLWKEGTPLMADKSGYAGLSQLARAYVGGLLAHAPALLAFCAPTTNSYRRLVPGYEAPVNLVYSMRNRSACIRIPMYSDSPKAKRVEFRCPDAAANPYLAFSAMLMAGIDGIQKGLDAGEPADCDLFEEDRGVAQVPGSLAEALDALERDHEFLTAGGVFSEELIRTWIDYKRENEVDLGAAPAAPGGVLPLLRLLMLELEVRPTDTLAARPSVDLRPLQPDDWQAVADIYGDGMRDGLATFETEVPSWETWDAAHLRDHRLVAELRARSSAGPRSRRSPARPCYARRRRGQRLRCAPGPRARDRARAARRG